MWSLFIVSFIHSWDSCGSKGLVCKPMCIFISKGKNIDYIAVMYSVQSLVTNNSNFISKHNSKLILNYISLLVKHFKTVWLQFLFSFSHGWCHSAWCMVFTCFKSFALQKWWWCLEHLKLTLKIVPSFCFINTWMFETWFFTEVLCDTWVFCTYEVYMHAMPSKRSLISPEFILHHDNTIYSTEEQRTSSLFTWGNFFEAAFCNQNTAANTRNKQVSSV